MYRGAEHVASFPGINGLSEPIQTRRHSSRMRTARLLTVRVLMAATGRQCRGGGGYVSSEQV